MDIGQMGDEFVDKLEDVIFGISNKTAKVDGTKTTVAGSPADNTATAINNGFDPTEDPFFADDAFFYPDVIDDEETCKWLQHHKVPYLRFRLWDLLLFLPSSLLLTYLLFNLQGARQKLRATTNASLYKTFHLLVLATVVTATLRCLVSMAVQAETRSGDNSADTADKVLWVMARFVFLLLEVSVIGLSYRPGYAGSNNKAGTQATLVVCLLASGLYCSVQAFLEINKPFYGNRVASTGFDMYGQGGPVFLAMGSILASLGYAAILAGPLLPTPWKKPFALIPQPTVFYSYIGFNLVLEVVTAVGSILLASNLHSGMCLTSLSHFVYFSCLPVAAFLAFVRPWLRTGSQPDLLLAFTTTEDGFEAVLHQSGSIHSLHDVTGTATTTTSHEPSIVKQGAVLADTAVQFRSGILSPDSPPPTGEDGFLILN